MSKINIDKIVKDIKSRSNSLTPIIEAVCNSFDAIGFNRTDGLIDIIVKRDGQQKLELEDNRASADIIAIDIERRDYCKSASFISISFATLFLK